jgi:putative ABC transport system permease protein
VETLWQDLRYGVRMLARSPSVTLVAVLALALGIGANTAIFSVVNGVLLRPMPYPEPDRLVWFWETQPELPTAPFSAADFVDYQKQNQSFEEMAAIRTLSFTLTGMGPAERMRGHVVTPNYFRMQGVQPAMGRDFAEADGRAGAPRVAILTHGFWQRRFGGDANILGKPLTLNGEIITVAGVMPARLSSPPGVEFWVNPRNIVPEVFPNFTGDVVGNRSMHYLGVMGRLKRGVTLAQAQADINTIVSRLQKEFSSNAGHGVRLLSFHEYVTGDVRPTLLLLLAAVGVVLMIACANVANLLLARAAARTKEIAIRTALGAGRARIVRQLLTESVLLALLGGGLGLMLAYWGVDALVAAQPADLPRLSQVRVDGAVLGYMLGISLLTGLIFGLAPALEASRPGTSEVLKEGSRSVTGGVRRNRVRSLLVISEVALALMLLSSAGLLIRSLTRLLDVKPGFNEKNLVTMWVSFSAAKYSDSGQTANFIQQLLPRIESQPGVEGVALSNDLPLEGQDTTGYATVEGRAPDKPGDDTLVGQHAVNAGYFRAMGIPLLKGREFTERDAAKSTPVAIINERMARRFWPNEDPLGKKFKLFGGQGSAAREVVGVVGNVKHNGLNAADSMDAYASVLQDPWPYTSIALRSKEGGASLLAAVRTEVQGLDPNLPVHDLRPMAQVVAESLGSRRMTLSLIGLFAGLALILAAIGIYGVISYSVTQRTHEIGIRMALGAQRSDVFRMVVGHSLGLTLIGVAVGLAASLALTRLFSTMLFGITATDPVTLGGMALLLGLVAYFASYMPARRAMRIDPMAALRHE